MTLKREEPCMRMNENPRLPRQILVAVILTIGMFAPLAMADSGACLPFSMPDSATLFNSPRKIFAHYFYPFPLSITNKAAAADYYSTQYLDPKGEKGKSAALGGYLRQRPLPVPLVSSADWQLRNVEAEIRMAIA